MAKYLLKASYTVEGTKGLLKEGGSARRAAVEKMLQSLGGRLESLYFTFGDSDVISIIDLPDATSATALSFSVRAAGGATVSTVPLVTPEEVDAACKKPAAYRAPGS